MLPEPLHPAVVHFPIVLTVLLPLVAFVTLLVIRRGGNVRRLWAIPLSLAAALTASAWFAEETGGEDEERVEEVVSEEAIDTHEERAERFVVLSGALLAVMGVGLVGGNVGRAARLLGTVGAVALLVPMALVGSSGGELVYEHGAASAWTDGVRGEGARLDEGGGEEGVTTAGLQRRQATAPASESNEEESAVGSGEAH